MSFLGSSSEPIEQLPALLKMLDCDGQYTAAYITCNESLCLIPKKRRVLGRIDKGGHTLRRRMRQLRKCAV